MTDEFNPIQRPLMQLFGKLNHLNGLVFIARGQLKNFCKLVEQILSKQDRNLETIGAGASLVVRDLTEWPDNGWAKQYASGGYEKRGKEYMDTTREIERVLSTFVFAQGYEAFETFLLDITACYLHQNPSDVQARQRKRFEDSDKGTGLSTDDPVYWQELVRYLYRGKDNKKVLKALRGLSSTLAQGEKENNRGIDLQKWFTAASKARHAATHSWGKLDEKTGHVIPIADQKYFPTVSKDGRRFIQLYYEQSRNCLHIFAEYGFLVFKCLSHSASYDWNIFDKGFKTISPEI